MRSANMEENDEGEGEKLLHCPAKDSDPIQRHHGIVKTSLFILAALCVALMSFSAGLLFGMQNQNARPGVESPPDDTSVPQVPIETNIRTFRLDLPFTSPPKQNTAEPAWDSLLPNGLGYVNNTKLASDFSVVSVFHQLHCLYTLRRAYYAEQGDEGGLQDFDFGHERSEHAGHCFEYLRQSLMCSADSSIEPAQVDHADGKGFLGWDVPRKCRNYDQLKQWAEERRAFDAHGFLANDIRSSRHG